MLISGLTVMIAMAGMFLAGNAVFSRSRVGTILVVAVAVLGSLTVLPAMLSKLGDRVEKGRVPFLGRLRHRNHGESRVWGAILDRVLAAPGVSRGRSAGDPASCSRSRRSACTRSTPASPGLPRSLPIMQTYDRIQAAFPGGPLPAVDRRPGRGRHARPRSRQGIAKLERQALAHAARCREPVTLQISPDKTVAVVIDPAGRQRHRRAPRTPRSPTLRDDVDPADDRRASPASRPT